MVDLTGRQPGRKTGPPAGAAPLPADEGRGGKRRPPGTGMPKPAQACSASTFGSPSPSGGEDSV